MVGYFIKIATATPLGILCKIIFISKYNVSLRRVIEDILIKNTDYERVSRGVAQEILTIN